MSATDYVSNSLSYDLAETKLKFSPNYCMDFFKLIVKVVEFIFCAKPNRVEVWAGFFQVVTWICQGSYIFFLPSAKPIRSLISEIYFLCDVIVKSVFCDKRDYKSWGDAARFFKSLICCQQSTPGSVVPLAMFIVDFKRRDTLKLSIRQIDFMIQNSSSSVET